MLNKYGHLTLRVLRNPDVQIFGWCAGVILLWRACLELINQAIVPIMTSPINLHYSPNFSTGLLRWVMFDAGWYLRIINHGYIIAHHLQGQETIAFFPAFPTLVRYTAKLLHTPPIGTGEVLDLLLFMGAAFFLYKLTLLFVDRSGNKDGNKLARIAVLFLVLDPASFFFASVYADALLVMSTTAAFYFAMKKSWFWAAVFAGVATGCKSIGIAILPALVIMYVQANWDDIKKPEVILKKHVPKLIEIGILGMSGLLVYMAYLYHRFHDPLLFIKIEKYWARSPSLLAAAHGIYADYKGLFITHGLFINTKLSGIYNCAIPIMVGLFVLYLLIRHRLEYIWLVVFAGLVLAMPMSTGELASINRYVLVLTPLFAYTAAYLYSNKYNRPVFVVVLSISTVLLFIFSASFLAGYFMG
jgi:hypothetical protein